MRRHSAEIYKRYGFWYVCFGRAADPGPIHVAGPFRTQAQAREIVRMRAFANLVAH